MTTIHREATEWCDIWLRSADRNGLPRLLCIGDSITRGYYPAVEKGLEGRFACARLATSRFATDPVYHQELALVLGQYRFAVIHFNNGLHGWDFSEDDYREGMLGLVELLRRQQPGAKLVCATSTPIRLPGDSERFDPRHQRVVVRNRITSGIMAVERIPLDDLFPLALARPDWFAGDGIHYNESGCAGLAAAVCASVTAVG